MFVINVQFNYFVTVYSKEPRKNGTFCKHYDQRSYTEINNLINSVELILEAAFPVVDICHVVGTPNVYKYWPLLHFPPTVGKCVTI